MFDEINETRITETPDVVSESSGNNTITLPIHDQANNDTAADKKLMQQRKQGRKTRKRRRMQELLLLTKWQKKFFVNNLVSKQSV